MADHPKPNHARVSLRARWKIRPLNLLLINPLKHMPNHFHLVLETPKASLVAGMKWLLGAYTAQVLWHLFSGRCKPLIVDGSGNGYLRTVCDYVHLNPACGITGVTPPQKPVHLFDFNAVDLLSQYTPPGDKQRQQSHDHESRLP